MAIPVAKDDKFQLIRNESRSCMNFVRSMAGPNNDCSLGPANQVRLIIPCFSPIVATKYK